ncbi:2OG-Fe(II) oxygenase [Nitrogeniibacter mangrovi]|uniref:2OG-Fe(II) oxygenase n=1 Tax=Nitrogeniibacter mangrovi TaxID=2016596 RepID=A0A6C1B3Z9_9RHOO|nr:2OG-Fe(II) oxygenase [Nitrogeniibacter mangrovi]QID18391.1 2OG-Fe(II) oxygenase [Nitrogeniibacter mangrovi]
MAEPLGACPPTDPPDRTAIFDTIAEALIRDGHAVITDAVDSTLTDALCGRIETLSGQDFSPAAIGRAQDQMHNNFVRRDEIRWLDMGDPGDAQWLRWADALREHLNRRLFLGLFSYEAHYAHYAPGAFYKRHVDAFRGQANRILTTVLYLNPDWLPSDGGQMLLYPEHGHEPIARIEPALGTLAVFLSEEFPHEVLPARQDRYSIAGWFRVNASTADRVDPPR